MKGFLIALGMILVGSLYLFFPSGGGELADAAYIVTGNMWAISGIILQKLYDIEEK